MNHQTPTATRRGIMKLASTLPIPSVIGNGVASRHLEADEIILQPDDIPDEFERRPHDISTSDFINALTTIRSDTNEANIGSSCYLRFDDQGMVAGICSGVVIYDGQPPQSGTVRQLMDQSFEGFPEDLAGDSEVTVTTRIDATGAEWRIRIPSPDWHLDVSYRDVIRVQVVGNAILTIAVYGPISNGRDPLNRAREYSSRMRDRVG